MVVERNAEGLVPVLVLALAAAEEVVVVELAD